MVAIQAELDDQKTTNAELLRKTKFLESRLKDYEQALMTVEMAELKRTIEVINLKAEIRRLKSFAAEEQWNCFRFSLFFFVGWKYFYQVITISEVNQVLMWTNVKKRWTLFRWWTFHEYFFCLFLFSLRLVCNVYLLWIQLIDAFVFVQWLIFLIENKFDLNNKVKL